MLYIYIEKTFKDYLKEKKTRSDKDLVFLGKKKPLAKSGVTKISRKKGKGKIYKLSLLTKHTE